MDCYDGYVYRVDRNNFYRNEKKATVYTPAYVSDFLYDILSPEIPRGDGLIFDPCVGRGSLLRPWQRSGYAVRGIDIKDQGFRPTRVMNYLELKSGDMSEAVSLVIMNPPFNIDSTTKKYIREHYSGRPLLPEVWFAKALELFGPSVPIAMFTPYGFRLNQTTTSRRWVKFLNHEYPDITGIVSLPKNVFDGILFHSEVLLFNLTLPQGHYFLNSIHESKRLAAA